MTISSRQRPRRLPQAEDFESFKAQPLEFLARARATHGDLFLVRDSGPVFSRATDCKGVVAAFGAENQRAVLADIESFGMPASAARHLGLSENLVNLNRGLHSMRGGRHASQKKILSNVVSGGDEACPRAIWSGLEGCDDGLQEGRTRGLLDAMRGLALNACCPVLFGERSSEATKLIHLLQVYFQLRRDASSPLSAADDASRQKLVEVGHALDRALRSYVRECRREKKSSPAGLIARLATAEQEPGTPLGEDEVVGHANVVFVSSSEPVAVALTWTLLILSQMPALRNELRVELRDVLKAEGPPTSGQLGRLKLLERVIQESLRLLPPNAFMVRLTTRRVSLNGLDLPENCEVILCPFLAHRDEDHFPRSAEFLPDRWNGPPPSPFVYFPFGAGGHACVGRKLATSMIKMTLARLLSRFDLVLAGDQQVDWKVHIMFMPAEDPVVNVHSADRAMPRQGGKLGGPVGKLLSLDGDAARLRTMRC